MPQATVVVPACNVEATLPATLASLRTQTHGDFEILVVDDGSTDRTASIARATGDPRVRLVQQPNRGLAGARNTGIHHARGQYVGFCDADDLWRPGKFAAHGAHLEVNPQFGLSYSGSELIDEAGRSLGLVLVVLAIVLGPMADKARPPSPVYGLSGNWRP